ncbi:MAG: hypothetical protein COB49_00395 [Alphaproteobacteria bacterium]|nr:MAG: hypothetical protein COB49_00395 [Alphaproteobacteria bacterium]
MTNYKDGDNFPDIFVGGKKTISLKFRDQMESDENITTAVWSSVPAGLIFTQDSFSGRVVGSTIGGGAADTPYAVICDVVTDAGQDIHAEKGILFKEIAV